MTTLFIVDAGSPESCQPLTCSRPLAAIPVANRPLREQQMAILLAAGLSVVETLGNAQFCLLGNAWVAPTDLAVLVAAKAPAVLVDAAGQPLAWTAVAGLAMPPPSAVVLQASGVSFAIRYPWDLLRVNELLVEAIRNDVIEGSVSDRATIEGRLVLGAGSRILPGVYIEGNVVIGRNCKIGPNCYLRGSTAIGDGCHVGQSVEIMNCILMDKVAVGHLSYVGDSILGARTNLGAGTITANFRHDGGSHRSMVQGQLLDTGRRKFGAILGDDVHTGIHTSLYPGRKLWPGTSTLPGTVVQKDVLK